MNQSTLSREDARKLFEKLATDGPFRDWFEKAPVKAAAQEGVTLELPANHVPPPLPPKERYQELLHVMDEADSVGIDYSRLLTPDRVGKLYTPPSPPPPPKPPK